MRITLRLATVLIASSFGQFARADFNAWVYEYGANTPGAAQELWTASNLVDTVAGAANATFSGSYNNEKNCFDAKTNTRWIQQTKNPWVIYRFPTVTKVTTYSVRQATNNGYDSRVPVSWELYGSNAEPPPTTVNDESWEKLDTRTDVFHNYSNSGAYGFLSRVMWLERTAEYSSYLFKVTANKSDGYTVIGELEFYNAPFPSEVKFKDGLVVSYTNSSFKVTGSFVSAADCEIKAVISDGQNEISDTVGYYTGDEAKQVAVYTVPSTLAADKTYLVKFTAASGDAIAESESAAFYNGTLTLSKTSDAKEEDRTPAVLTVSRAAADSFDLTVTVLFTDGTAKEGQNYEPAANPVVIPADETAAEFVVVPIVDGTTDENTMMSVSIPGGVSKDNTPAVTVMIENVLPDEGYVTWISPTDGKASNPTNWSTRTVPTATDNVLFDGRFSSSACEWDNAAPGTVASWTQRSDYTGTVTVDTTFDSYNATFTNFIVTGDVVIDGGKLSPMTHGNSTVAQYRLMMTVGGDFTVGSSGAVTAVGLGQRHNFNVWRAAAPHGGESNRKNQAGNIVPAFGSIFEPTECGWGCTDGTGGTRQANGGGAIYLVIAGTFANAGTVSVTSGVNSEAAGAGGSIYICAAGFIDNGGIYSADGAKGTKSDGCGAAGAGGRIALVSMSGTTVPANRVSCFGAVENWGAHGAPGTVYLKSATDSAISVKGNNVKITAATPIPVADDPLNWRQCAKKTDLLGLDYAHLRLTKDIIKMRTLSLQTGARASDLDLNGKVILVNAVFIDGANIRLPPGTYTYADAQERGWTWLKDSSFIPAVADNPETEEDESAPAVPGTGILRIATSSLIFILQ